MSELRNRLSIIGNELRGLRTQLVVLAVLALIVMAPYVMGLISEARTSFNVKFAYLAIGLILVGSVSRVAFLIAGCFLIATSLVLQHVSRHWGLGQLDSRLEAFYESPTGETVEYLRSHVDLVDLTLSAVAVVACIALIVYARRASRLPRASQFLILALLAVWTAGAVATRMDMQLRRFPPLQFAANIFEARYRYAQLSRRAENLSTAVVDTSHCDLRYDKIVIVLGESAITDHMSVFGYPRRTTPFADASAPHKFNALSPANQTRYALAMMLTDATPDGFDRFFESPSLVTQLRACGMKSLWISNQGRRGQYDSLSTSLALEADEQVFLNEWSWTNVTYDGRIVEELEKRGDFAKKRQATFIHLIGSHTQYSERYPPGFGFPDVSDTVSQYDNSLLYTDHVLGELYKRFHSDSTLFIYVSDHGQIVSNETFGSGFLPGYREEYRTPLLIWTRDETAIARLHEVLGTKTLNLESFDDLVRFLAGMAPEPQLSTSTVVAVLSPKHLKDYASLPSFRDAQ